MGNRATEAYNLEHEFPDVAVEWHSKNSLLPSQVTPFSKKKVWWKCSVGHEWEAVIIDRTASGSGCSISVDRIDPGGGYTKDNVRFVLNQVNVFRQNGPDDRMYEIAAALLDHRKSD